MHMLSCCQSQHPSCPSNSGMLQQGDRGRVQTSQSHRHWAAQGELPAAHSCQAPRRLQAGRASLSALQQTVQSKPPGVWQPCPYAARAGAQRQQRVLTGRFLCTRAAVGRHHMACPPPGVACKQQVAPPCRHIFPRTPASLRTAGTRLLLQPILAGSTATQQPLAASRRVQGRLCTPRTPFSVRTAGTRPLLQPRACLASSAATQQPL